MSGGMLVERIDALLDANGKMAIQDIEQALWPDRKSHRYQSNGGPPGCRMSSMAAVRRGGFWCEGIGGGRIVYPRSKKDRP